MTVSARDLRRLAGQVLRAVRAGERVAITYRGREIGVIQPVAGPRERPFQPVAFGLWRRRSSTRNVSRWLDRLRRPRTAR